MIAIRLSRLNVTTHRTARQTVTYGSSLRPFAFIADRDPGLQQRESETKRIIQPDLRSLSGDSSGFIRQAVDADRVVIMQLP